MFEIGTLMVGKWGQNGYSESQNSDVRQAHPRTKFVEEPPPPRHIHPAYRHRIIKGRYVLLTKQDIILLDLGSTKE